MSQAKINPKRGEIWRVRLDPVVGSEQGKTRPIVVLSQPPMGRPTMRLGAIITGSQPIHQNLVWCVTIPPNANNGLTKVSTADTAQTRALDIARFEAKLGQVGHDKMEEIKAALISAIGGAPKS